MAEGREFHKPGFLTPHIKILEGDQKASSLVRKAIIEELPRELNPGEEIRTEHFYIKEFSVESSGLFELPGIGKEDLGHVARAIMALKYDGKEGNLDELVTHFSFKQNKPFLKLKPGQTIRNKLKSVLPLLEPENLLRSAKELYELHQSWFKEKLPHLLVRKLFVVGFDEQGAKRAYIIKPEIKHYFEENGGVLPLDDVIAEFAKTYFDESHAREVCAQAIRELSQQFSQPQRKTISEELKIFISVARKLMDEQDIILDLGARYPAANIRISTDGHLHMIDTDRVFSAENSKEKPSIARQKMENMLKSLSYIAEGLQDSNP